MPQISPLSFDIEPLSNHGPVLSIIPVIGGNRLTALVEDFERAHRYEPAGGYGGLVPAFFKYGPLDEYLMATTSNEVFTQNSFYLLGCQCGEVGCWPLIADINNCGQVVEWKDFKQPFRPERDYSGFGPFLFDPDQYRQAVLELASKSKNA